MSTRRRQAGDRPSVLDKQYRAGHPLTQEEERHYALRWRNHQDQAALQMLVLSCMPLVIKIARSYSSRGYDLDDLVQEGNIGLLQASRRFDPDRGTRLTTYASWWIRSMILAYVTNFRGQVKFGSSDIPSKVFFGLGRARKSLEQKGETVDVDSLAKELGVPKDHLDVIIRAMAHDVSLNAPVRDTGTTTFDNYLVDEAPSPEDLVIRAQEEERAHKILQKAISNLRRREQTILRERRLAETPTVLRELSGRMGISRARIQQIEKEGNSKLQRRVLFLSSLE